MAGPASVYLLLPRWGLGHGEIQIARKSEARKSGSEGVHSILKGRINQKDGYYRSFSLTFFAWSKSVTVAWPDEKAFSLSLRTSSCQAGAFKFLFVTDQVRPKCFH